MNRDRVRVVLIVILAICAFGAFLTFTDLSPLLSDTPTQGTGSQDPR